MKPETCYTCRFKTKHLQSHPKTDATFAWLCFRCWGEYLWTALVIEPEDYVSTPEKLRDRDDYEATCIARFPVSDTSSNSMNPGTCYTCRFETTRLDTYAKSDNTLAWLCYHCWMDYHKQGFVVEPGDYVSTFEKLNERLTYKELCDALRERRKRTEDSFSRAKPNACYTCRFETARLATYLKRDGSCAWLCWHCWLAYQGDVTEPEDYFNSPTKLAERVAYEQRCNQESSNSN